MDYIIKIIKWRQKNTRDQSRIRQSGQPCEKHRLSVNSPLRIFSYNNGKQPEKLLYRHSIDTILQSISLIFRYIIVRWAKILKIKNMWALLDVMKRKKASDWTQEFQYLSTVLISSEFKLHTSEQLSKMEMRFTASYYFFEISYNELDVGEMLCI